jgi:hypothetical protein
MKAMRQRVIFIALGLLFGVLFDAVTAYAAWQGPIASPPNSNVSAPINVGSIDQSKNANIGVNGVGVFGNSILDDNMNPSPTTITYLNFSNLASSPVSGSSGYGFRDNNGTLQYKDSTTAGSWTGFSGGGGGGASQWVNGAAGSIYYNGGNVGVGTSNPFKKLEVNTVHTFNIDDEIRIGSYYSNAFYGIGLNYRIDGAGTPSQYLVSYYGGTRATNMTLATNGRVGFGTASPSYNIDVQGNVNGSYVAGFINAGTHGAVGQGTQYGLVGYNTGGAGVGVLGQAQCGNSTCYGIEGVSGAYYGTLGRADGYSFVGSGGLYNAGTVQANAFVYLSDIRLKTNIENLDQGLVTLMKLRPVSFTWNQKAPDGRAGKDDIGFIAQEVEKILPGAIETDPATGYKEVDYPRFVPILVKSVQEQEATIAQQQAKIDDLEARISKLEARISQ